MLMACKILRLRYSFLLAGVFVSACSTYQPLPLREGKWNGLVVDTRSLPFAPMAAHHFDPDDGLDIVEVAMFAVVNNPDLRLVRDDAAIAHAQSFSAGLLPDPQLSLSGDLSNSAGAGATKAFNAGLNYDITSLLTHSALHRATESDAAKTDLTLLWQEWQVASQAQLLFVKVVQGRKQMTVLNDTRRLFADRYERTRRALDSGLVNSDAVTPNLAALQDVDRQLFDLKKLQNQAVHELNALLGLAPDTVLIFQPVGDLGTVDAALAQSALADIARRRPDLRALQAAYQAEDQRYRSALLAQFPALTLGFTRARDSSDVYSSGVGITMSLPFLNRNRGNIAIGQASRQKAYDEYQVRVQAARSDVQRILEEQALNLAQAARLDADLQDQSKVLARSDQAFRTGDADVLAYALARSALLARQLERITLEQAVLEQRVALSTVLGIDMTNLESTKP
ncbi:TolC family protein [Duganella vulcania]|uniref:TolC family protein n=1 Tax=Duganella vulcania TaxID=2692166 RepID=A0A845GSM1_9BURK|nr:TolC family protein [Duganella vulcania]MYM96430.1 TolC family protein [Duganella vulcania]